MSQSSELEAIKMDDERSSPAAVEVNSNSKASAGEKRKPEGQSGSSSKKLRSRVWDHFTKIVKEDGQSDKCQCNHCHKLFSCSSRSGTTHLLRHIADGICHAYKKDKDSMVTISSNNSHLLPWKYSQGPAQYTVDAEPEPESLESLKQTEDNVGSDGHGQPQLPFGMKVPKRSASKYQQNGEALMEDFGSFASKLVELVTERIGTSRALASANSGPDFSISAAVKCLNEFEDIPQSSEMYLDAVEILEDAGDRECFLCLPPEPRRRWLQRVLHRRHPLRYSSKM